MESLLFWVIVGIVAGMLAKAAVPGAGPGGLLGDLATGVIGAFVGGWLFVKALGHSYGGWIGSTFVAFIGAVILLMLIRMVSHRQPLR